MESRRQCAGRSATRWTTRSSRSTPRVISWKPGYVSPATGKLEFGGWIWRYDLTSQQVADEAIQLYRGLGDDEGVGRVLWGLSSSYYFHGDIAGGLAFARRALDVFEGSGDVFMIAWSHYIVGTLVMTLDRTTARQHLIAAYRLFTQANDTS